MAEGERQAREARPVAKKRWHRPTITVVGDVRDLVTGTATGKPSGVGEGDPFTDRRPTGGSSAPSPSRGRLARTRRPRR